MKCEPENRRVTFSVYKQHELIELFTKKLMLVNVQTDSTVVKVNFFLTIPRWLKSLKKQSVGVSF